MAISCGEIVASLQDLIKALIEEKLVNEVEMKYQNLIMNFGTNNKMSICRSKT